MKKDRTFKNEREQDNIQEQIAKHSMKFVKVETQIVKENLVSYLALE